MRKIAVLIPAYKRPEYTEKCVHALTHSPHVESVYFFLYNEDGTIETERALKGLCRPQVYKKTEGIGLRRVILDFFREVQAFEQKTGMRFDFLSKIDNDCVVPADWLVQILKAFDAHPELDIVSPNVFPSNAAFKFGTHAAGKLYRPAEMVGGLWTMRRYLIDDIVFEDYPADGIGGAWALLRQIKVEKSPEIGWLEKVVYQDIGHHSGAHPDHIKSESHYFYSQEVGRPVAWTPQRKRA